jgi:hypothetical protein
MATEVYDIGDRPVLTATFRDEDGVATAMTTIAFKIISPSGTVVTNSIANASAVDTGVYDWQIPEAFDESGRWVLRAQGTAPIETAAELVVRVRDSAFD